MQRGKPNSNLTTGYTVLCLQLSRLSSTYTHKCWDSHLHKDHDSVPASPSVCTIHNYHFLWNFMRYKNQWGWKTIRNRQRVLMACFIPSQHFCTWYNWSRSFRIANTPVVSKACSTDPKGFTTSSQGIHGYIFVMATSKPYVYWTMHHCDSWRITDQLDVTIY